MSFGIRRVAFQSHLSLCYFGQLLKLNICIREMRIMIIFSCRIILKMKGGDIYEGSLLLANTRPSISVHFLHSSW